MTIPGGHAPNSRNRRLSQRSPVGLLVRSSFSAPNSSFTSRALLCRRRLFLITSSGMLDCIRRGDSARSIVRDDFEILTIGRLGEIVAKFGERPTFDLYTEAFAMVW